MTTLGIKNKFDCTCKFCINHHCVLEKDEEGFTISRCHHIHCENNKNGRS